MVHLQYILKNQSFHRMKFTNNTFSEHKYPQYLFYICFSIYQTTNHNRPTSFNLPKLLMLIVKH
jgi:hypothetical protein